MVYQAGPKVSIKKAVVRSLRKALSSDTLSVENPLRSISDNIDMEYPVDIKNNYPGIWVQFSFRKFQKIGVDDRLTVKGVECQVWGFEGTVSLNIMALTNKARDSIADALIETFAFDYNASKVFWDELASDPDIHFSVNKDILKGSGESLTIGSPTQDSHAQLQVFEDVYSFDLIGQFASQPLETGGYRLRRIDLEFVRVDASMTDLTEWQ